MTTQLADKPIVNPAEIPTKLFGHQLSQKEKDSLSKGQPITIQATLQDGRQKNAQLSFYQHNGETKLRIDYQRTSLDLPDELASTRLTEQQKKELLQGKVIHLTTPEGLAYFQLDTGLNKIVALSQQQLKLPSAINGHILTPEEKAKLANLQSIYVTRGETVTEIKFSEQRDQLHSIEKQKKSFTMEKEERATLQPIDQGHSKPKLEKGQDVLNKLTSTTGTVLSVNTITGRATIQEKGKNYTLTLNSDHLTTATTIKQQTTKSISAQHEQQL